MGEKKIKQYLNMDQLIEKGIIPWSKKTLRRRIKDDGFPAIKDIGGYLFDVDDVELWMKKRKENYVR